MIFAAGNAVAYQGYYLNEHIKAETKWMPFPRRHFQINFLEWKRMNFT